VDARLVAPRQARQQRGGWPKFAKTLEKVCVDTVEDGFMTKDLALLVGADQRWLSTNGFLDKVRGESYQGDGGISRRRRG